MTKKYKKIVFGGPNLRGAQWTWFYTASTIYDSRVHGHPGDEVPIVTQDEAKALRKEIWAEFADNHENTAKDFARIEELRAKRLIYDKSPHGKAHDAQAYVDRGQATIEDTDEDPREYLGLKQRKPKAAKAAREE